MAAIRDGGGLVSEIPHSRLSAGGGFHKEGEGNRTERLGERAEKFSTCKRAQSVPIRTSNLVKQRSGVHRPGFHCLDFKGEGQLASRRWTD